MKLNTFDHAIQFSCTAPSDRSKEVWLWVHVFQLLWNECSDQNWWNSRGRSPFCIWILERNFQFRGPSFQTPVP